MKYFKLTEKNILLQNMKHWIIHVSARRINIIKIIPLALELDI